MKFQFFTFSINPIKQMSLFSQEKSKNEIFNEILNKHYKNARFKHYRQELGFTTYGQIGDYLFARLGRRSKKTFNHPPEQKFEKEMKEDWPGCIVIFDLNPQRQNIAFEYRESVFKHPLTQLEVLAKEMNVHLLGENWEISIRPKVKVEKFWEVVNKYKGQIDRIDFSFLAPNVLDLTSKLYDSNKKVKEAFNNSEIEVTIKNDYAPITIPQDNGFMQDAVEIAEGGGASIKLKIKKKKVYDSNKNENIESKDMPDIETEIEAELEAKNLNSENLKTIFDKIFS